LRNAPKRRGITPRIDVAEVAIYYRRLAAIATDFPAGFAAGRFSCNGNRIKGWAEQCRAMASHFDDANTRRRIEELAESYDQLERIALAKLGF